ncbi:MAG: T9SS type A sorting domain-containing protein [Bacteroidia bacterium]|nr:T9SS type A sorting domain-containing protein [Bacteroidota bacterium]MBP6412718.1 T9SS type A sorting domain-containing protein [Bacteroidia bacterium]
MKKFLLAVSLFFAVGSQAQNINLIDLEGNDVTNGTVYIFIDTASIDPYEYDLHVANATSVSASINCARTLNNLIPNAESYFCWDQCYSPIVDSAQAMTINAMDTLFGTFHAYYNPFHQLGASTMRYQFFNTNSSDTANITLVINATPSGIKNVGLSAKNKIGNAYPNPAAAQTSINYSIENASNSYIKITDAVGMEVYQERLSGTKGTVRLNANDFSEGVYFYSLYVGSTKVSTKKLVITQ